MSSENLSAPFHGWNDSEVEHAKEMQKRLYQITGHSDGNSGPNAIQVRILFSWEMSFDHQINLLSKLSNFFFNVIPVICRSL